MADTSNTPNTPNTPNTANTANTANPRTAVVTGASGGVGGALVRLLAARGWHVIAPVRAQAALTELNAIDGVEAEPLDLADGEQVRQWAERAAAQRLDRLDLLAHVAAAGPTGKAVDAGLDLWESTFAVNVIAPATLTSGLIAPIRAAHGTVVFVNSGAGTRGVPNHAVYAASKHALRGYADTLRLEESANGVRVSTVAPGPMDTRMLREDDSWGAFRHEDVIDPASVASAIAWVADATPDVQIANVDVRPRQELSIKVNRVPSPSPGVGCGETHDERLGGGALADGDEDGRGLRRARLRCIGASVQSQQSQQRRQTG